MTNQEKKAFLSSYLLLEREIEEKLEEIERLHALATRVTSHWSPAGGGGKGEDRTQLAVEKIDALNRQIQSDIESCLASREKVCAAIETLSDMTQRIILEYRYLNGATWEQIAEKMGFTYQWVCALHNRALNRLAL